MELLFIVRSCQNSSPWRVLARNSFWGVVSFLRPPQHPSNHYYWHASGQNYLRCLQEQTEQEFSYLATLENCSPWARHATLLHGSHSVLTCLMVSFTNTTQMLIKRGKWKSDTLLMKSADSRDHPSGISYLLICTYLASIYSLISLLLFPI